MLLKLFITLLPWPIRRLFLGWIFGYQIHPSARIGLSWIFPRKLQMNAKSRIGHFNIAVHLDSMTLDENSVIGRGNWITGFPSGTASPHFRHQPDRESSLEIGCHAAITKNHHLDCTSRVAIGDFTTIAGYQSQFLSHSIDLRAGRQHSEPITIGNYCFIGTNVVILGGARIPDRSVLGAKSLLQKDFDEQDCLYAGVPAERKAKLPADAAYFHRDRGFVI